MVTQTNKSNINPSATKHPKITLLSPDIYGSSTLSNYTTSVIPERITPNKKSLSDIRKEQKWILGEHILIIVNLIQILKYLIHKIKDIIQLFHISLKITQ